MGEETACLLVRFGAAYVQAYNTLIVLGGIGRDGTISRESDIVLFTTADSKIQMIKRLTLSSSSITSQSPRPLLVGSSVVLTKDRNLAIISGAATCFSMGTFCRFSAPHSPVRRPYHDLVLSLSCRDPSILTVCLLVAWYSLITN